LYLRLLPVSSTLKIAFFFVYCGAILEFTPV